MFYVGHRLSINAEPGPDKLTQDCSVKANHDRHRDLQLFKSITHVSGYDSGAVGSVIQN